MSTYKLITCVMQENLSKPILKYLKDEKKILRANTYSARGSSFVKRLDIRQMDVLTVVVDADMADEVFEYIYYEAKLDRPHGGSIFVEALSRATGYELPKL